MNDLTGKKVYIIVEIDKELDQGEDLLTVEAFTSLEEAKRSLNSNFEEVLTALKQEEKTINFEDKQVGFADVETDDNRWHWEIQSSTIQ